MFNADFELIFQRVSNPSSTKSLDIKKIGHLVQVVGLLLQILSVRMTKACFFKS